MEQMRHEVLKLLMVSELVTNGITQYIVGFCVPVSIWRPSLVKANDILQLDYTHRKQTIPCLLLLWLSLLRAVSCDTICE